MFQLHHSGEGVQANIKLTSSKSLSNRALIIQALTDENIILERLATADDTQSLQRLLASEESVLDVGPAGTTFRFLTAYLCRKPGVQLLTGSQRMLERPIGVLVDALRALGASIEYVDKEGFPPLKIGYSELDITNEVTIQADVSSQYISALLLIAPSLPNGLRLRLEGKIVSLPYIKMTLALMEHFGVAHTWEGDTIVIASQVYVGKSLVIEADWSAASYFYSLAAIAPEANLHIEGLFEESLQGDAVLKDVYTKLGVQTTFTATGIQLIKQQNTSLPALLEYDFLECPDIAQTVVVSCAALGIKGLFTGLETLKIKETDRVAALKKELKKVQAYLSILPERFSPKEGKHYIMLDGHAKVESTLPTFATYHDHRMAMALAPLGLLGAIRIQNPMVVTKSYPEFYEDFQKLGFVQEEVIE